MKTEPSLPSVLVLHNIPRESRQDGEPIESEAGVLDEVQAAVGSLQRLGVRHRALGVRLLSDVDKALRLSDEEVVFNLVEGFHRDPQDRILVPGICEAFGKGCTGASTSCMTLVQDKWETRKILTARGWPVPAGVLVPIGTKVRSEGVSGPYFVKPAQSDASEGITASSVFQKVGPKLRACVRDIHDRFRQPALVEQYFGCREVNVSVLQRGNRMEVLPIAEIDFSLFKDGRPRIMDYASKWMKDTFEYNNTPRIIPAPLSHRGESAVRQAVLGAWAAVGCQDYARVDIRIDEMERLAILEVNDNPDISPDGGFAAALDAAKISYDEFILAAIENAAKRRLLLKLPPGPGGNNREGTRMNANRGGGRLSDPAPAGDSAIPESILIRASNPEDREAILSLVAATGFFRQDEIEVAREVLDDSMDEKSGEDYESFTALWDGEPVGWVCWGPTPCTVGVFDIYWIAVAPRLQGRGIGMALMDHAERLIRQRGGRLVVVETSGQALYESTRRFYLRTGYVAEARIADFYNVGDDKVMMTKRV